MPCDVKKRLSTLEISLLAVMLHTYQTSMPPVMLVFLQVGNQAKRIDALAQMSRNFAATMNKVLFSL